MRGTYGLTDGSFTSKQGRGSSTHGTETIDSEGPLSVNKRSRPPRTLDHGTTLTAVEKSTFNSPPDVRSRVSRGHSHTPERGWGLRGVWRGHGHHSKGPHNPRLCRCLGHEVRELGRRLLALSCPWNIKDDAAAPGRVHRSRTSLLTHAWTVQVSFVLLSHIISTPEASSGWDTLRLSPHHILSLHVIVSVKTLDQVCGAISGEVESPHFSSTPHSSPCSTV